MGFRAELSGKALDHIEFLKFFGYLPAEKPQPEGFALKEGGLHT